MLTNFVCLLVSPHARNGFGTNLLPLRLTADGRETTVPRAAVVKMETVATSLMPPGLDRALEPKALADLVAFLRSLQ